jgi:hypothetical protein
MVHERRDFLDVFLRPVFEFREKGEKSKMKSSPNPWLLELLLKFAWEFRWPKFDLQDILFWEWIGLKFNPEISENENTMLLEIVKRWKKFWNVRDLLE